MKVSMEMSLYPLTENYIEVIKKFIEGLKKEESVTVVTNSMSTQVIGDSKVIFNLVDAEMERVFAHARASLVIKIIKAGD